MAEASWIDNVGDVSLSANDEFLWMIPTYYVFCTPLCLTSPWFSFADENWLLRMMPSDGISGPVTSKGYVALFLWKKDYSQLNHKYNVQLGVKRTDGTNFNSHSANTFCDYGFGNWNFLFVRYNFFTRRISNLRYVEHLNITLNGHMKIFCVIRKMENIPDDLCSKNESVDEHCIISEDEVDNEKDEKNDVPEAKGLDRLVQNLKSLLLDGQNSDTVLKADEREFRVHKAILAARSTVFASMFQHDMAEKTSGVVDIPDCTGESFEAFLHYLYTGSANNMSKDNVFNLYYAADKYRVNDLKAECVEFMKSTLSVDNFCDVITLSLRHSESELQKAATRFFCKNIKKIIKTVQWQKYMSEHSTEANELLIKALNA